MAKGGSRPGGGRPPGRRGRGGVGPSPGYRAPETGKGTPHKSSSVEGTPIMTLVYGIGAFVFVTMGAVVAYLMHGYGVI